MQWLEVCIEPISGKLDELCALLEELGVEGLVIEDGSDFDSFLKNHRQYWDYVDEELYAQKMAQSAVKFYLADDDGGRLRYQSLSAEVASLSGNTTSRIVKDEDWETNWMQYYKAFPVGEKLYIVPEWEEIPEAPGRVALRLNPGLIFGTGSHPTTAMCLEELEKYAPSAARVLDLGCGSGILSIASLVLGAGEATGCDIDPIAPLTAMTNAGYNGIAEPSLSVYAGNILSDDQLIEQISAFKYDLILANIVADVIIELTCDAVRWLAEGGHFICSGILEGRQAEVISAIESAGMDIISHRIRDDWHCFTAAERTIHEL